MKAVMLRTLSALMVAVSVLAPARAADLTAYTVDWAPYNYAEQGVVKGLSTDILRAMCHSAKIDCDIRMVPWARGYKTVQNTPNTLVFTTARKPSRESEFLWVGPIVPRSTWVYGRAGQEKSVRTLQDLAQLRIGVVRGEAAQQDLLDAGVPASSLMEEATNAEVVRLLVGARVDAMVETELGMAWHLRNASIAGNAVTKLVKLSDGGAYYYALNLQTDPKLVQRLQDAMDRLRRSGKLQAIAAKYTSSN